MAQKSAVCCALSARLPAISAVWLCSSSFFSTMYPRDAFSDRVRQEPCSQCGCLLLPGSFLLLCSRPCIPSMSSGHFVVATMLSRYCFSSRPATFPCSTLCLWRRLRSSMLSDKMQSLPTCWGQYQDKPVLKHLEYLYLHSDMDLQ